MAAPRARIRTMRTGGIGEDNDPDVWWGSGGAVGGAGGSKEEDLKERKGGVELEAMSPLPAEALTCKGRRRKDLPPQIRALGLSIIFCNILAKWLHDCVPNASISQSPFYYHSQK